MPKILIVEDDFMIADMAEDFLARSGYDVCGIARSLMEAVDLATLHRPDIALIDFQLADGELGTDVARALGRLSKVGVLYATGNSAQVLLVATDGHACLTKPYRPADLLSSLRIVAEIVAGRSAVPPLPRGLHLLQQAPRGVTA